jgi:MFS family permease
MESVVITSRQRFTLLAIAVAGHAFKHMLNAAFFVLLPQIKVGLGLSNIQVGTMSTIRGVVGGLANIPAGFAGDRWSSRRAEILGLSIVLVSLFALMLGRADSFWMAVVASSLFSAAITFWHPSAIPSIAREFASRRGFAIALHGTGGSIGETLGPVIAGTLAGFLGWRLVFQGSLIPGLLFGSAIWLVLRSIPANGRSDSGLNGYLGSVSALLRNGRLLLVLAFAAGFTGGTSTVLTFLPIYLDEELGASSAMVGVYLALAQVGGIVSQPLMGYASDRLGRKAVLSPSGAILGVTFMGLGVVPAGWLFGITVAVMGAFLFPLMSLFLASAMDLVETGTQATTVSLVFGSAIVVSAFAPAIAGILADSFRIEAVFYFSSGIALATSFLSAITLWHPSTTQTGSS